MSVIEFARQRMEEESREPGIAAIGGPTWMEP